MTQILHEKCCTWCGQPFDGLHIRLATDGLYVCCHRCKPAYKTITLTEEAMAIVRRATVQYRVTQGLTDVQMKALTAAAGERLLLQVGTAENGESLTAVDESLFLEFGEALREYTVQDNGTYAVDPIAKRVKFVAAYDWHSVKAEIKEWSKVWGNTQWPFVIHLYGTSWNQVTYPQVVAKKGVVSVFFSGSNAAFNKKHCRDAGSYHGDGYKVDRQDGYYIQASGLGISIEDKCGCYIGEIVDGKVFLCSLFTGDIKSLARFWNDCVLPACYAAADKGRFEALRQQRRLEAPKYLARLVRLQVDAEITVAKAALSVASQAVSQYQTLLADAVKKEVMLRNQLDFTGTLVPSPEELTKDWDLLAKMPEVDSVEIDGTHIVVTTKTIDLYGVPMGPYTIIVDTSSNEAVTKENRHHMNVKNKRPINGWDHPHIGAERWCLGGGEVYVHGLMAKRRYTQAVQFIVSFLGTYHRNDGQNGAYDQIWLLFKDRYDKEIAKMVATAPAPPPPAVAPKRKRRAKPTEAAAAVVDRTQVQVDVEVTL